MSTITVPTIYFDKPGSQNTTQVLEIVKRRAKELEIETILVASTCGDTGVKAAQLLREYNLVVISHAFGFAKPNDQELTSKNRVAIEATGAKILTCQHAFWGISRAIRKKWNTIGLGDVVSSTFRIFGEGMKVCAEIALMSADAGLVQVGKPCISVAGTGHGADTAVLLNPVNTQQFFDLRIMKILAKPHLK